MRTAHASLTRVIGRYLTLKQALGRRYDVERRVLADIDAFLRQHGTELTPETFARWCVAQAHLASGVRRNRMRIVRNLCLYRRRTEPLCFVPDVRLFPPVHQARTPYPFTEADISRVLAVTTTLAPTGGSPIRAETYHLAIVLLYTTGMRRGELTRLTVGDYDPRTQVVQIRASKFHKSRVVPVSADAAKELAGYLRLRRQRGFPVAPETPLLWHRTQPGRPYSGGGLGQGLRRLFRLAGLRAETGQGPRVHDVRHAFAVHALVRWYRAGADVQSKLPLLAAYMGHVSIVSTERYLHFLEPLATAASTRFAQHYGTLITPETAAGGAR